MGRLVGEYRGGKNEQVNFNDSLGRIKAIEVLKKIKGFDLIPNPKDRRIDLLHVNGRGGCDVEEGKWKLRYKDQNPINFNQFTLEYPTANFQHRKEKYFNEYYDWVTETGNLKTFHHPDYEYNSLIRFNYDFTEFFFVDYKSYLKKLKNLGKWATNTVFEVDNFGNKKSEFWMCWELKDVEFYILQDDNWIKDTTFDNPEEYEKYLKEYQKSREKFLNKKDK